MSVRATFAFPLCCLFALAAGRGSCDSQNQVDVTVRHAPYVVSTVSSKSEHAWARCKYCGSRTSYERKYKWDVYNHKWIETTDPNDVPTTCHHCRSKDRDQKELDQRERELDAKIKYEESRRRIDQKEEKLRRLRNANR